MQRRVIGFVALAFTVAATAGAADAAKPGDHPKRETPVVANSNLTDTAIPQLAPNLNVGPEVPMARETNPAAAPVTEPAPLATRPRNTLWMILAVLVVLLGGPLLKRLRSRSGPS